MDDVAKLHGIIFHLAEISTTRNDAFARSGAIMGLAATS